MPTLSDTISALRRALRPIESPFGESCGGPDGWRPDPEAIEDWSLTFQDAANPEAITLILDALEEAQRKVAPKEELATCLRDAIGELQEFAWDDEHVVSIEMIARWESALSADLTLDATLRECGEEQGERR